MDGSALAAHGGALSSASPRYLTIPSSYGTLALVWDPRPRVLSVLLPGAKQGPLERLASAFPDATAGTHPAMDTLAASLQRFLEGVDVSFDLGLLAWDRCSGFQRAVLRAEAGIPRGRVSSYGRIARHLGPSHCARAVGQALARNPFPLIIPCHRAIRADGALGGYQGGLAMKRALLAMEGVSVPESGQVVAPDWWY